MSVLVDCPSNKSTWLFCKGAPESVLQRCSEIRGANGDVIKLTAATKACASWLERDISLADNDV